MTVERNKTRKSNIVVLAVPMPNAPPQNDVRIDSENNAARTITSVKIFARRSTGERGIIILSCVHLAIIQNKKERSAPPVSKSPLLVSFATPRKGSENSGMSAIVTSSVMKDARSENANTFLKSMTTLKINDKYRASIPYSPCGFLEVFETVDILNNHVFKRCQDFFPFYEECFLFACHLFSFGNL